MNLRQKISFGLSACAGLAYILVNLHLQKRDSEKITRQLNSLKIGMDQKTVGPIFDGRAFDKRNAGRCSVWTFRGTRYGESDYPKFLFDSTGKLFYAAYRNFELGKYARLKCFDPVVVNKEESENRLQEIFKFARPDTIKK